MYFTGIIFTFFLALILLGKRDKSRADYILFGWLLVMGSHLGLFYLHFSGQYARFPHLLGFEWSLSLLHGPFMYLYTASLTDQYRKKQYMLLHFLPAIIICLILSGFILSPSENKIAVYRNGGRGYELEMSISNIAYVISNIIYFISSLLVLRKHRRNIMNQFSSLGKVNLLWLRYLIIGYGLIFLSYLLLQEDEYIFGALVLYILFIGYYGIRQVGIFTRTVIEPVPGSHPEMAESAGVDLMSREEPVPSHSVETAGGEDNKTVKYRKSGLNDESANEVHQSLCKLMAEEKLYKNPELSLTELAQKLEVNPNILSQIINSIEQKNFYDYVNELRIQEFKELIALNENQKFTLLALAYECGFNSKTSFNRNFKKITGISPTEYLSGLETHVSE